MLVSTAIARIKSATHDISDEYSEARCIEFINNAMQQTSALLISARYPSLVKEIVVHNGDSVPANFMVAAGVYPLKMTNNQVTLLNDYTSVNFRYFSTPTNVETSTDVLPFNNDAINEVIIQAAILLAKNENEYEIAQDQALFTVLQQAIAAGMQ